MKKKLQTTSSPPTKRRVFQRSVLSVFSRLFRTKKYRPSAITKVIWQKLVFLGPLFLVAFLILIFIGYHLAYWQKIFPGVTVLDHSIGNQDLKTASETISQLINQAGPSSSLTLESTDRSWQLELTDFNYQPMATAEKAWQIGRHSSPIKNLQQKIRAWTQGINLSLEYDFSQENLNQQINEIANQIFIPLVEPTIKIVEQEIEVTSGKDGFSLNKEELISIINSHLSSLDFRPIDLPLTKISTNLTKEQIDQTQARAEEFLSKKLVLTTEEMTWELNDEQLVQLLSFTNGFDQEKIASWSADLVSAVNRPPQNAAFEFSQGRVSQFRAAKEGINLEEEKTVDLIARSLAKLEAGEEEITTELPITLIPPQITTADVNQLGIQELVGQGISFFWSSISSRIHNIELASSKLNGLLIPPGQVFSFNQSLGDVSLATGFKQAYIIQEGRTVLGDGGGVCQVSTTLFRAALDAGLPIIERRAHAYRVSYYEQKSPVGLDATVFDPTANLKFKNDTPAHLLIQAKTDVRNRKLTFELYGTPDGRTVFISKSRIWDQVPPPPDLYQDDPTLPVGQVKQIDWQAWGAKVSFDYRVERGDEVLQERTFYSVYRPWQAIYLKGTKPL